MTSQPSAFRAYWVTFTGVLAGDTTDEERHAFLARVTNELHHSTEASQPALFHYGDGQVILSGVVRATSRGMAIDIASAAFDDAVAASGGRSNISGCNDGAAFGAKQLPGTEPLAAHESQITWSEDVKVRPLPAAA